MPIFYGILYFMKTKKSVAVLVSSLIVASLIAPAVTLAYTLSFDDSANTLATTTQLGTRDPAGIVFTIVNTGLIFLGMVTVIIVIVAGFMWLLAAGTEEKITKAKDLLKGAVVGLIIVLMSYGLAQYVFTALVRATQPTSTSTTTPTP